MSNKTPKIIPKEKPSLYNDEAIIGAGIGSIVLSFPIAIGLGLLGVPAAGIIGFGGGTLLGGFLGGGYGKSRMEDEAKFGKPVKSSSYINRGLFSGGFGGMLVAETIRITALSIALATGAALSPALLIGSLALPLLGGLVGAVSGSTERKKELDQEYQLAMQQMQKEKNTPARAAEPTQDMSLENTQHFTNMIHTQRSQQKGFSRN